MIVQFSLKSELKTNLNDATIKFYGELKLAVNTLLHAVYQKTCKKTLEIYHLNELCAFKTCHTLETTIRQDCH